MVAAAAAAELASSPGRPDWTNFRLLGNRWLWGRFFLFKLQKNISNFVPHFSAVKVECQFLSSSSRFSNCSFSPSPPC
jgi:hypothetical protein